MSPTLQKFLVCAVPGLLLPSQSCIFICPGTHASFTMFSGPGLFLLNYADNGSPLVSRPAVGAYGLLRELQTGTAAPFTICALRNSPLSLAFGPLSHVWLSKAVTVIVCTPFRAALYYLNSGWLTFWLQAVHFPSYSPCFASAAILVLFSLTMCSFVNGFLG